ncbi:MAG: HlyD family efflux transporter periplasmic adaptor subunit [Verrucomicrobia bacterium]|nr:HlyD family efflux transporter periplasmic adaptor subunit [Verrucomicrobiota bacterium]
MDIQRPSQAKAKLKKRIFYGSIAALALIGITVLLARLKPAAPTVSRNLVWMGDVKRGEMLRQVRGLGTLVPEEITWIAARTQGRVAKIVLRPGAVVTPDSVILLLSNPSVEQAATTADSALKAAIADLEGTKVQLESSVLLAESTAASAKADAEQAKLKAEVNEQLFKDGLVSALDLKLLKVTADQLETRNIIEQKRYAFTKESIAPQLAVKEAEVDRLRGEAKLRRDELDSLTVRAGMTGVLQLIPAEVDVGSQIQPGTNLCRVADPKRLKAEIRVAETQAKDIAIGQLAQVDTRNGVVDGKVSRIDPSVQNGTVTVDVLFSGELPKGSRPDLSVDGTIELERLTDVVYVGRPAFGQEKSTVGIFKLVGDKNSATEAVRVQVELGRSSVNTIEIVRGLQPGDWVILSDMSQYDSNDRVRLD